MVSVCLPSDALLQHLLSYLGFSYLGCGVSSWLLQQSTAAAPYLGRGVSPHHLPPDLECGIAPLGPPGPTQPLLLGRGVAPLGRCPDLGILFIYLTAALLFAKIIIIVIS